jgi:hypothetical protein
MAPYVPSRAARHLCPEHLGHAPARTIPSAPLTFSRTWNVRLWPTGYVMDHNGIIRYKNLKGRELEEAVERLSAELTGVCGEVHDGRF